MAAATDATDFVAVGGNDGVYFGFRHSKDEAEMMWCRATAELGFPSAQFILGTRYAAGNGVQQNHEEAARWYFKSANQGYADAQFALGLCFLHGRGVWEDHNEAIKWFCAAANQGLAPAHVCLGACYE